jgi:predicted DNA-binding protein (MmcQ/YjbR family)
MVRACSGPGSILIEPLLVLPAAGSPAPDWFYTKVGSWVMTRKQFDAYCRGFQGVSHVVQWGGASVWKDGGKIFAICSTWGVGRNPKISFKCANLTYSILCEQPGIIPAPYLARAKWVQIESREAMSEKDIMAYIKAAHGIIAGKLSKAKRRDLGLSLPE